MRIALAGNPNSGKTTMYNALTGRNEKVLSLCGKQKQQQCQAGQTTNPLLHVTAYILSSKNRYSLTA